MSLSPEQISRVLSSARLSLETGPGWVRRWLEPPDRVSCRHILPSRQPSATVVYDIHSRARMSEGRSCKATPVSHAPVCERVDNIIELEAAVARCSVWLAATLLVRPGDGEKVVGLAATAHIAVQFFGVIFCPTYCTIVVSIHMFEDSSRPST